MIELVSVLVTGLSWVSWGLIGYVVGYHKAIGLRVENDRLRRKINYLEHHLAAMEMLMRRAGQHAYSPQQRPQQRRSWQTVLGLTGDPTRDDVMRAYHRLAKRHHPDVPGGSVAKMKELNIAKDEALRDIKQRQRAA